MRVIANIPNNVWKAKIRNKPPQAKNYIFFHGVFLAIVFCSHFCTQGIQFYTQLKTVTQLWREEDTSSTKATVAMPVMK